MFGINIVIQSGVICLHCSHQSTASLNCKTPWNSCFLSNKQHEWQLSCDNYQSQHKPKADHYCSASSAKIPLVLAKPDTVFRLMFRHRHYQSNDSGSSTCVVDHHLAVLVYHLLYHPNFTSMLSNVCKYWHAWLSPQYHNTQRHLLAAHQMVVHVWNQHCDSEWSDLFTLFSSKHCFFKLQDTMKQLLPIKQAAWMTTKLRQLSKPTSSQKQITIAVQAVQNFHLSWQSLTQSSDSYFVTDITRGNDSGSSTCVVDHHLHLLCWSRYVYPKMLQRRCHRKKRVQPRKMLPFTVPLLDILRLHKPVFGGVGLEVQILGFLGFLLKHRENVHLKVPTCSMLLLR